MSAEVDKKRVVVTEIKENSKGLNGFLWLLSVICIAVAAIGNVYVGGQFSLVVRVLAVAGLLIVALLLAALTNQGRAARRFFKDSQIELRKIVWPTRSEATQTTFIVMGVTVVASLILWGLDSIVITLINFLTVRF